MRHKMLYLAAFGVYMLFAAFLIGLMGMNKTH